MDVGAVLEEELTRARDAVSSGLRLVLVEGESDRVAVQRLARRVGAETSGVAVIAIAGATNVGAFLELLDGSPVLALCDEAEEQIFSDAFQRIERPTSDIFVCKPDLEAEMIAALGTDGLREIIEEAGEKAAFRRMQAQPDQRNRALADQLHRFIGTRSGRKIRYAQAAAEAVDLESIPEGIRQLISQF